jgi:hypothetical protein
MCTRPPPNIAVPLPPNIVVPLPPSPQAEENLSEEESLRKPLSTTADKAARRKTASPDISVGPSALLLRLLVPIPWMYRLVVQESRRGSTRNRNKREILLDDDDLSILLLLHLKREYIDPSSTMRLTGRTPIPLTPYRYRECIDSPSTPTDPAPANRNRRAAAEIDADDVLICRHQSERKQSHQQDDDDDDADLPRDHAGN